MTSFQTLIATVVLATFATATVAQAADAAKKPGAAASAACMGGGMGMGGGMNRCASAENTYGWVMMTPQEREEHQKKMMDLKSQGECKGYMGQHHQRMADRAKQRGGAMPGQPPRDMCEGLK
jgi:hypothetical protein